MRDYITGRVKICDGCFSGIEKARIVVPFESSIMLDWDSFDRDAEIEFVLRKNLTLKQIFRRFDAGYDYEHENWTLVGDKKIIGQCEFAGDNYAIMDYTDELEHKVANFTTNHIKHKSIKTENKIMK